MQSRRCMYLDLSPTFLARFFSAGVRAFEIIEGVPADAVVINATLNFANGNVRLLIQSDEFPEVPEGNLFYPHPDVVLRSLDEPLDLQPTRRSDHE